MTTETLTLPTWTPPKWLNALMKLMLHTPVVQGWIGETIALITFTGRRTGMSYTTPVTYYREGDTVIVITKKPRNWWRNLLEHPEVELRLKGRTFEGHARASVGSEAELPVLLKFLENRPFDAKAYGVTITPEGVVNRNEARRVLMQVVLIRITLN
jgi:deazaflavin-dependent oxidoreductase (nitroreductase family)